MQLTLDIDEPMPETKSSRDLVLEIMRRRGPCRAVSIVCDLDCPSDAYDVFYRLVDDGLIQEVGEVRYRSVVPEWNTDKVYAVKEAA